MEHIGCTLRSDFRDYYDNEFSSTTNSREVFFARMKSEQLEPEQQVSLLKRAGMNLPQHGTLAELIKEDEAFFSSHDIQDVSKLPLFVVYDQASPRRITLKEAKDLPPHLFAMRYMPVNAKQTGAVLRYIQIGHLNVWLMVSSKNHWLPTHGDMSVEILSIEGPLLAYQLATLNRPLFSIDFLPLKNKVIAVSYSSAPNLIEMGLEDFFESKLVARAIFDYLDGNLLSNLA